MDINVKKIIDGLSPTIAWQMCDMDRDETVGGACDMYQFQFNFNSF